MVLAVQQDVNDPLILGVRLGLCIRLPNIYSCIILSSVLSSYITIYIYIIYKYAHRCPPIYMYVYICVCICKSVSISASVGSLFVAACAEDGPLRLPRESPETPNLFRGGLPGPGKGRGPPRCPGYG